MLPMTVVGHKPTLRPHLILVCSTPKADIGGYSPSLLGPGTEHLQPRLAMSEKCPEERVRGGELQEMSIEL